MKPSLRRLYRTDIQTTLRISLPIIVAQLGIVMMGVADTIQVGNLGAAPVAASGIGNHVFILIAIIGLGTLSVVAPQVAAAHSRGDNQECNLLLRAGIRLGLGIGIVLCLIILFISLHFNIFLQTPEVESMTIPYLQILGISVIPLLLFTSIKQFSDGLAYTRISMVITLIGLAINIILNWLLIEGNLGFPAWGLNGSAISTLIARIGMAVMIGVYVFRSPLFGNFVMRPAKGYSFAPLISKLLKLGLPGGLQLFFEVGAFAGAAIIAGWLGTVPLAAHEISINLASVTYMVAAGIGSAGAIRVGQAYGAGNQAKIIRAGTISLLLAIVFMATTCVIFLTLNTLLVELYIQDQEVIQVAATLVIIGGFFQLSDGIQVVGLGILRGIEDVYMPTIIALFAYWVIGLPLGYVLGFTFNMNVQGIWLGLLAGLTVSAILLTFRFYTLSYKIKQKKTQSMLG